MKQALALFLSFALETGNMGQVMASGTHAAIREEASTEAVGSEFTEGLTQTDSSIGKAEESLKTETLEPEKAEEPEEVETDIIEETQKTLNSPDVQELTENEAVEVKIETEGKAQEDMETLEAPDQISSDRACCYRITPSESGEYFFATQTECSEYDNNSTNKMIVNVLDGETHKKLDPYFLKMSQRELITAIIILPIKERRKTEYITITGSIP